MSSSKFFFEIPDSKYGEGVMVNEYHGLYSIASARKGKDGHEYMDWCYPQGKDRKPLSKGVPWKITFGNRAVMIAGLKYLLNAVSYATEENNYGE